MFTFVAGFVTAFVVLFVYHNAVVKALVVKEVAAAVALVKSKL